jgi:hypothetical protein
MVHTLAELANQEADLLPERETLQVFGRNVDIDVVNVTNIFASNDATALFGSNATAAQVISTR